MTLTEELTYIRKNWRDVNWRGMLVDLFWELLPEDPYAPCFRGCDVKVRYVLRDATACQRHVDAWVAKVAAEFGIGIQ